MCIYMYIYIYIHINRDLANIVFGPQRLTDGVAADGLVSIISDA